MSKFAVIFQDHRWGRQKPEHWFFSVSPTGGDSEIEWVFIDDVEKLNTLARQNLIFSFKYTSGELFPDTDFKQIEKSVFAAGGRIFIRSSSKMDIHSSL